MLSRRLLATGMMLAAGVLAGANVLAAGPAAAGSAVPQSGFTAQPEAHHGLCLDAQLKHDMDNGGTVMLWTCTAHPFRSGNQLWNEKLYTYGDELVNGAHGLCLQAVRADDQHPGDRVELWRCQSKPGRHSNQLWEVPTSDDEIISNAHGLCLNAVRAHDVSDGDKVDIFTCNRRRNQLWSKSTQVNPQVR